MAVSSFLSIMLRCWSTLESPCMIASVLLTLSLNGRWKGRRRAYSATKLTPGKVCSLIGRLGRLREVTQDLFHHRQALAALRSDAEQAVHAGRRAPRRRGGTADLPIGEAITQTDIHCESPQPMSRRGKKAKTPRCKR